MRLLPALLLMILVTVAAIRTSAQSEVSTDSSLRIYAVHVSDGLYGVYLGKGLIITAAHVVGSANAPVQIADLNLQAKVVKRSPFEELDLALLSVDEEKLPISLRLRRMPLCQRPLYAGEPVIVAIPEGTARSQVVSPLSLPRDVRKRFSTAIKDVATTGNSGSGVFDANLKCLLGIMSRKISITPAGAEKPRDIAKYFVPAAVIRAFIPSEYRF